MGAKRTTKTIQKIICVFLVSFCGIVPQLSRSQDPIELLVVEPGIFTPFHFGMGWGSIMTIELILEYPIDAHITPEGKMDEPIHSAIDMMEIKLKLVTWEAGVYWLVLENHHSFAVHGTFMSHQDGVDEILVPSAIGLVGLAITLFISVQISKLIRKRNVAKIRAENPTLLRNYEDIEKFGYVRNKKFKK